jgi:hypothetical protein
MELSSHGLTLARVFLGGSMNKPRLFQNKNVVQLLKYKSDIMDDITFCDKKADELGFGAGADFYRRRSVENKAELERIVRELTWRGACQ